MQKINNTATGLSGQMEQEITQYLTRVVNIGDVFDYSQYKLTRRIFLFENKIYPTGKFDSQGNYKFWFDIITPRIEAEIKNIDFDTKNVLAYSERKNDELPTIITNLRIKEYMRNTGQAEEINSAIEEGSGWGNVVWKKVKKSYERVDLRNFYVINQTARTLDETPVIERHQFTSSDLRKKKGVWNDTNIDLVLSNCKSDTYKSEVAAQTQDTTVPYYEIYERNGDVSVKDLKETQGELPLEGDENRYVFARVIGAGTASKSSTTGPSIPYILYAEELTGKTNSSIYKEYHRSRYKGRWWREGLYELLFDLQVRANMIGNQIALGLEGASRQILGSADKLVIQNVMSDLKNGDIIKTSDLKQIDLRMHAFDQLIADWNRIMAMANEIANSREIVQGDSLPSGTPFRMGALLNQNANKLFDFIREKLAIPFSEIFEEWLIPEMLRDMKAKDVLRLTGDPDMLARLYQLIVDDWYLKNLINIGPHTPEIAVALKEQKLAELKARPQLMMSGIQEVFREYAPHVCVVITGENSTLDADLQTYATFIEMEADPVRRSALIEMMMKKKGVDVAGLPKSEPQLLTQSGSGAPSPMIVRGENKAAVPA